MSLIGEGRSVIAFTPITGDMVMFQKQPQK
jgi:hypothetical protein